MNLPDGYTFTSITDYTLISNLLRDNYVESTNNTFRFNYKPEFIEWYLTINTSISIGIKDTCDNIIGFICGRLIYIMLYGKEIKSAEINFLCLDKKIRNNKLCPILINEITKEFNKIGIYEAIYTSEHLYNNNNMHIIANVSYYIRLLNIKKLVDIEYIKTSTSIDQLNKLYKIILPKSKLKLIKLTNINVEKCFELYNTYYKQFDCYDVFTLDIFEKIFISEHINTYILINNDTILDFISYSIIDVSVVKKTNTKYFNTIDSYMYYYTNVSNNLKIMIELLLPILKENSIDTFKALNIMDNTNEIFSDLKFINEKSNSYYYLFSNNILNFNNNVFNNNKFAKILF